MTRRWMGVAGLVGLVLVVVLLAVALRMRPADRHGTAAWFLVRPGASLASAARDLEASGLIRDARLFTLFGRLRGDAHRIKPGRYRLTPAQSTPRILNMLVGGETVPVRMTFPEGIWLTEIAGLLADSLAVDSSRVVELSHSRRLIGRLGIPVPGIEGYCFPDTYDFETFETAGSTLARLIEEGNRRWTDARQARADSLGLTRHEILTLASIIEAETALSGERALVSAVYHRRLRQGMLLQADPTVIYGLGARGRRLTYADLELDSPYNTYRYPGLPPGPIGNPGEAAVDAALHPDPSCTALYFVARGDGSHVFSDTFREHEAARRRARESR